MRNNKVIKGIVLGSTVLSMLVGQASPSTAYAWEQLAGSPLGTSDEDDNSSTENTKIEDEYTDIMASAKTKYNNEIDLYNDTGEVVGFYYKFDTLHMRDTQKHFLKSTEDGYYFVSDASFFAMSNPIAILDNTNSVKKVTVDGKKSYKLNNPKVSKNDGYTYYDFDDKSLHDLGVKFKSSPKLKYSTLSEGKHTLTIKDKHGHKVTYKVWKDTKAPKAKDYKKGNKWITKATDKGSGIGEIKICYKNGKEKIKTYKTYKKTVKVTFSNKEWKKLDGIYVEDRAGNRY